MARYFIGIPTDSGTGHVTIKFLGELDSVQEYAWRQKLDDMANIEKFPVQSAGLGILGRHNAYLVDYIKDVPRLKALFDIADNTAYTPHVTVKRVIPETTGPIQPMDGILANKVSLYKNENGVYTQVYSVDLKKRKPLTWISDQFNKFGEEMDKTASKASWIEAGLMGGAGYLQGKKMAPQDPELQLKMTAGGAILGPIAGRLLRTKALSKLKHSKGIIDAEHAAMQEHSMANLYEMRNRLSDTGSLKIPGVTKSMDANVIYDEAFAPEVNNMVASRFQREAINEAYTKAKQSHDLLPFGLGTGFARESFEDVSAKYTKPHQATKLEIKENVIPVSHPRRKYIYDTITKDRTVSYKDFAQRMKDLVGELS